MGSGEDCCDAVRFGPLVEEESGVGEGDGSEVELATGVASAELVVLEV